MFGRLPPIPAARPSLCTPEASDRLESEQAGAFSMTARLWAQTLATLFVLSDISAASAQPVGAAEPTRSFAVVSDLHFDPFAPPALVQALAASMPSEKHVASASDSVQTFSRFGEYTNLPLLFSAMKALSRAAGSSDFVL